MREVMRNVIYLSTKAEVAYCALDIYFLRKPFGNSGNERFQRIRVRFCECFENTFEFSQWFFIIGNRFQLCDGYSRR